MLLMPAAVFAWSAAFARKLEKRVALLCALVAAGTFITLLTEVLSAFHSLTRLSVAIAWALFAVAALPWARNEKRERKMVHPSALNALYATAIAGILVVIAFTAYRSAPSSADAMAYHLPRVLYWVQNRSVAFFPTSYFNQITLQPGAEYVMLHTYLLTGGDRFVNFVQFAGFAGSIVAVSALAGAIGLDRAGQSVSALVAATLPNAVLQASGAKNDCLLALWLVCAAFFAVRWAKERSSRDAVFVALAAGLTLFTKATGYLFLAPLVVSVLWPLRRLPSRRQWATLWGLAVAGVLLLNGTQYWRNFDLSGSILGYDSAQGDGFFRWRNESLGWKPLVSNLLRNVSDQLGARSERWNAGVYRVVLGAHKALGIDPQDPGTTWHWSEYGPPKNTNQEADANNRWHFLLILFGIGAAAVSVVHGRDSRWILLSLGIACSFLAFCLYLKWQPFLARLFTPLFIAASPLAAFGLRSVRNRLIEALVCLFLVSCLRLPLFQNWTRPLQGEHSLLREPRDLQYFNDMSQWNNRESYLASVDLAARSRCDRIGIDGSVNQLEYPFEALLRERLPTARFTHVGVINASERFRKADEETPCLVWCPDCAGVPSKEHAYEAIGTPRVIGRFLVFAR